MSRNITGQIRSVTPNDSTTIDKFNYIQAGVNGDIVVQRDDGATVTISAALLSKMAIVPVGIFNKVLATGTTATDIYVW